MSRSLRIQSAHVSDAMPPLTVDQSFQLRALDAVVAAAAVLSHTAVGLPGQGVRHLRPAFNPASDVAWFDWMR
jgi:hypothetical protein